MILCCNQAFSQQLAAFHDNMGRFQVFDNGRIIQAEYLPVTEFSVGGQCLLYTDNRNNLKMYYKGTFSTLEVNAPDHIMALDYLAVYSFGGVVKIINNGKVSTISTSSIEYQAEDSLVTFYDRSKSLLAVFYKGRIHMLEDGLAGRPNNSFKTGDNLVAYISSRTQDLKVFYHGENRVIEPFQSGGSFETGRDVVAYVNQADLKFRVFHKGEVYLAEEFPPESYQTGDGLVAYVDNTGSFRLFIDGEFTGISSRAPEFYEVKNRMVIYHEQGYFKVWYNYRTYTLETYIPDKYKADWNTIIYKDLNRNVKIFTKGESKVLTYDLAEEIELYRDVVVINKGMNNHNVYFGGKKY
jgi:hypothetical protein